MRASWSCPYGLRITSLVARAASAIARVIGISVWIAVIIRVSAARGDERQRESGRRERPDVAVPMTPPPAPAGKVGAASDDRTSGEARAGREPRPGKARPGRESRSSKAWPGGEPRPPKAGTGRKPGAAGKRAANASAHVNASGSAALGISRGGVCNGAQNNGGRRRQSQIASAHHEHPSRRVSRFAGSVTTPQGYPPTFRDCFSSGPTSSACPAR